MLFSHAGAYAVRALLFLARKPENSRWLASEIAQSEDIPLPTLSKVLVALKGGGMVRAARGPSGGYVLGKRPESISLADISRLFDTDGGVQICELLLGTCGDCTKCPMTGLWDTARDAVQTFLDNTTLDVLAKRADALQPRSTEESASK